MKVKELIKKLKKMPKNATVVYDDGEDNKIDFVNIDYQGYVVLGKEDFGD